MAVEARGKTWLIDAAVFTALVYAATVLFQVYQPSTGGYFNLGESVIYLSAMISDPFVAGLAGGVGASLADATTGYGIFAPATLIIKFSEGFIAGLLVKRLRGEARKKYTVLLAGVYGALIGAIGVKYLTGSLYLGTSWQGFSLTIPFYVWILIGVLVFTVIMWLGVNRHITGEAVALLSSGLIMVTGYFLYEYFVSNPLIGRPRIAAVFEIPVNIGQAVIGAAIAISIYGFLRKAGYKV